MKLGGEMWIRDEDAFMPQYFEASGDRFEIENLDVALSFCASRRTAIDVGAHYGSWSRYLARQFERTISFEPVKETFDCLIRNTDAFANIFAFNQAVGDRARMVSVGVGKMYAHPGMETVTALAGDIQMVRVDDL